MTLRTLIALAAAALGLSCSPGAERQEPAADQASVALREMFLALTPEKAGIPPGDGANVWGAAMDWSSEGLTATLVSLSTGSASLYLSTGGGVVGGEAHQPVREAAQAFVESLGACSAGFTPDPAQDLPPAGQVRFYALARSGLLRSEAVAEAELAGGKHPLSPCFQAARGVIARLRAVSEGKPG